jgi:hypothetical protein
MFVFTRESCLLSQSNVVREPQLISSFDGISIAIQEYSISEGTHFNSNFSILSHCRRRKAIFLQNANVFTMKFTFDDPEMTQKHLST